MFATVVFISLNKGYGGAEKYFENLYNNFVKEVNIGNYMTEFLNINLNNEFPLRKILKIKNKIVILNNSVLGVGFGWILLLKMLGNKVILYPHIVTNHNKLKSKLAIIRNLFRFLSIKISDEIVIISDGNYQEIAKLLKQARKTPYFIYNYVECENDRQINLLDNNREIAIIGRIQNKHKGQIDLVKAMGLFCKKNGIVLNFFGSGPDEIILKQIIKENDLDTTCILHGWVDEKEIFKKKFSFVLSNARWEGLPLSIIESIYNDRIVFATNINGHREIVFPCFLFNNYQELESLLTRFIIKQHIDLDILNYQKMRVYQKYNKRNALSNLDKLINRYS